MTTETLDSFIADLGPDPTILVERDRSVEMARLSVDGKVVHEGNYWDFHPGCVRGWHGEFARRFGDFSRPASMAGSLEDAFRASGRNPRVADGTYCFVR